MAGCSKKQYAIMMGSGPEGQKLASKMGSMEQEEFNKAFAELIQSDSATDASYKAENSKWSKEEDEDYQEFDATSEEDYGFDDDELNPDEIHREDNISGAQIKEFSSNKEANEWYDKHANELPDGTALYGNKVYFPEDHNADEYDEDNNDEIDEEWNNEILEKANKVKEEVLKKFEGKNLTDESLRYQLFYNPDMDEIVDEYSIDKDTLIDKIMENKEDNSSNNQGNKGFKVYEDKIRDDISKVKTKEDAEYVADLIDNNLEAGYISEELSDELYNELDKMIDKNVAGMPLYNVGNKNAENSGSQSSTSNSFNSKEKLSNPKEFSGKIKEIFGDDTSFETMEENGTSLILAYDKNGNHIGTYNKKTGEMFYDKNSGSQPYQSNELSEADKKWNDYKEKGKSTWNQKLSKGDKVTFKDRQGNDIEAYINGFYYKGDVVDNDTYEEGKDNMWHDFRGLHLVDKNGREIGNINANQITSHEREAAKANDTNNLKKERDRIWDKMPNVSKEELQRLVDIKNKLGDEFYSK